MNLCRACPVPLINCQHLRASIQKRVPTPITVRFATGRVEVWDDDGPTIGFQQAACSVKTMPIHSPADCSGCPLRLPNPAPQSARQIARGLATPMGPGSPAEDALPRLARADSSISAAQTSNRAPERPGRSSLVSAHQAIDAGQAQPAGEPGGTRKVGASPRFEIDTRAELSEQPSRINLLQKWLADQFNRKNANGRTLETQLDDGEVRQIVYTPIGPNFQEEPGHERCVGWTD